jgi:hypothetical protein
MVGMTTLLPLDGRLVLPSDDGYDDARQGWNLAIDQHPAAVAEAASVADVQAVVRHARAAGLRVAPQATGHGAEALALDALRGAILLKTAALDAIAIDPAARTATVGAGVTAGALAAAAGEHGLAPVLGLAPSVGVAGLTLGGGLGWLSRTHGLAANNVVALEAVTADGELVRADAATDADLFFALRGGGGRGAIVTQLTVALHAIDEVSAGMIAWPAERAPEVLEQVRRAALDAPECFSLVFRVLSLPPIDAIPEPIRGRRIAAVIAAHIGPQADGERLMAPLRGGPEVLLDGFGPVAPADLVRVAGDPEDPGPARGDGLLLKDLTPDTVETVTRLVADDALEALGVFEVRQLGGALARPAADGHGAHASIDAGWAFFAGGFAGDDGSRTAVEAALADVRERLAPHAAPRVLLSSSGGGIDPSTGFAPGVWDRLVAIRNAYDPDHLLLSNHDG